MVSISKNGGTISFRQDGSDIQYSSDDLATWTNVTGYPINIVNTSVSAEVLTVKFITDMGFTTQSHYFKCGSEYITFDGLKDNQDRATITFNDVSNCLGLIQNGDSGTNGYSNITVQNIRVASFGTTTLADYAGWVCQRYFGKGSSFALIDNCSSTGQIGGSGGGICGTHAGTNYGTATISNCYSEGEIFGFNSGGICGTHAGGSNGAATISNCYSTGEILGVNSGGICGVVAGGYNGDATISNCYSTGQILGVNSGGICGTQAGSYNGIATISNCYIRGNIGVKAGGICGRQAGRTNGAVTISNCYSEGKILAADSGGICGTQAGYDSGFVYISNCYSTGQIVDSGGGICGDQAGVNGIVTIANSYSLYATGELIEPGGMVASGNATLNDTYGANGTWSSTDANSKLTGTPTGSAKEGDVWGYHAVNTPYYLTANPTTFDETFEGMIASGVSFEVIIEEYPSTTATVSKFESIDFILNQTHWNTIKIEDSISGITSFVNKTNNNITFVATKLITLTT